jgi:hypothetical protein
MEFLPACFQPLARYKQFIVYVLTPSTKRANKTDKLPVDHKTGRTHNAHDPAIWLTATDAINAAKTFGENYGVGFVFTDSDPFWFLDIDECYDANTQQWSILSSSLIDALSGAALEVSSSGRGLHIIGSGNVPSHACKNVALNIELYTSGRFVALTGTHASGSADADLTYALEPVITTYFPAGPNTSVTASSTDWDTIATQGPRPEWRGPTDDAELIRRALQSRTTANAFGRKASFAELWDADIQALGEYFPDTNGVRPYDESSADAALAQHLCFWTGCDAERIRRLMIASGLNREKYEREDYLPRTILAVLGRQVEVLQDREPPPLTSLGQSQGNLPKATLRQSNAFVGHEQQIQIFDKCVYVIDDHKVLIPSGDLLNPERFKAVFGGHTFTMDSANARTSRNAFEAFTESQLIEFPKVNTSCFKPDETPGSIITESGRTSVNIYVPDATLRVVGDISPFLTHVAKLLPDPIDQQILIGYLASVVQHKGVKFQWCPLIQGVEGNGKTLFTRCLRYAIGKRYSHFPKAAEISSKFNDWLFGRIFIGVEDIFIHADKEEIYEALKPMITGEFQEIEAKGGIKLSRDICANFIINTNHKEGLRKTNSDRRFAPFYCAQQEKSDLKRDGMTPDYFGNIYAWLKKHGYAIVNEFLSTYKIPDEFNPALGGIAPVTSSTEPAIEFGRGNVEQHVLEAIEEGVPGFRGGFVSSVALDNLLVQLRASNRWPLNKRAELMKSLGYQKHKGLPDGRTNNSVLPDGKKIRIFVRDGHDNAELTGANEIAKVYEVSQRAG